MQQHSLEFKELQRHLDHEDTTKHFMEEKSEDRSVLAQLEVFKKKIQTEIIILQFVDKSSSSESKHEK